MSAEILATLLRMLRSPHVTERRAAIHGLSATAAPTAQVARALLDALLEERVLDGEIIRCLGRIPTAVAAGLGQLLEELRSSDVDCRRRAILHLSLSAGAVNADPTVHARVRQALIDASKDEDSDVRRIACLSLHGWSVEPRNAMAALSLCLEDASPEVRAAACREISSYGGALVSLVRPLVARLLDTQAVVRARAAEALGRVCETHRDASFTRVDSQGCVEPKKVVDSVSMVETSESELPTARDILCGLIDDPDPDCALASLRSLARLAPLSAEEIERIRSAEANPDGDVRLEADRLIRLAVRSRPNRAL